MSEISMGHLQSVSRSIWMNVSLSCLSTECTKFERTEKYLPEGLLGFCIDLALPKLCGCIELAIITTKEGGQKLAKMMLQMEEEEAPLEDNDLADALGEVVNVYAGALKGEVDQEGNMEMGLPRNKADFGFLEEKDTSTLEVSMGGIEAWLQITIPKKVTGRDQRFKPGKEHRTEKISRNPFVYQWESRRDFIRP